MLGKILFERVWVSAPSSTTSSDGLGPYYNAVSCDTCHPGGGGGYLEPGTTVIPQALVLHFRTDNDDFPLGRQWQPYATQGLDAELTGFSLNWDTDYLEYASGERVALHRPRVEVENDARISMAGSMVLSPRLAPHLHGIAALSSGANTVHPGLQGTQQTLEEQVALALAVDMGLGNPLFPGPAGDCTSVQSICMQVAIDGQTGTSPDSPEEIGEEILELLVDYLDVLTPPENQLSDDDSGYSVFSQLGCDTCHIQQLQQGLESWSDMVVHDMGEGLADRTLTDEAVTTKWRTAPLWGLAEKLATGSVSLLHDGRAASVEEAILWHEGEAKDSRDRFLALPKEQRDALLDFLSRL